MLELESYDPARLIEIIDEAARDRIPSRLHRLAVAFSGLGKDGELDKVWIGPRGGCRLRNSFAALEAGHSVAQCSDRQDRQRARCTSWPACAQRPNGFWTAMKRTGKTVPAESGTPRPVMRDGIEYEFDVCGEMDQENTLLITKSRCPQTGRRSVPQARQRGSGCRGRNGWRRRSFGKRRSGNQRAKLQLPRGAEEEWRGEWRRRASDRGGAHRGSWRGDLEADVLAARGHDRIRRTQESD